MVDLVTLQTISYIAGATSVVLGVIYYINNLREMKLNRRITLTTSMMQPFMTTEGMSKFLNLTTMRWSNIDDYRAKYDHRVNPQNFAERLSMWNLCENLGKLYREGLIDLDTLYGPGNQVGYLWIKFKPIIEMYRGTEGYSEHQYENFQYLADRLNEYHKKLYKEDHRAKIETYIKRNEF